MVTSVEPATIRYFCSTNLVIWKDAPCVPAMFIAPMVGVRFWNLSLSVIGNGTCAAIFEVTPPSLHRTFTSSWKPKVSFM